MADAPGSVTRTIVVPGQGLRAAEGLGTFWVMHVDTGTDWMTPSVRLWRMRRTQVTAAGTVVAVLAGLAAGIAGGAGIGIAAAAAAIAAAAVTARMLLNKYRTWACRGREEDLIVARGVL